MMPASLITEELVAWSFAELIRLLSHSPYLKTKTVVVGLGARKDSSVESIIEAVDTALEQAHVPLSKR